MKIEITAENFQKEIILPKDVYFVGATMVYDDSSVNVLYSNKLHTKKRSLFLMKKTRLSFTIMILQRQKKFLKPSQNAVA